MVFALLPSTRLSTRQLLTLIRLFVLEAPANQAAVGYRRQSPYGREILERNSPTRGPGV